MIRLGVIGYGGRMRHVLDTIALFKAGTTVAAVVDPRAQELRKQFPDALVGATFYDDVDTLLDRGGVDGVLIGTRCSLHTPYATKVLERNLPLFLEKPVATSWEQLMMLRTAAARSSSPVVVSFPLRLSAMCQTAKSLIAAGTIGTVEQVQAVNNVPLYGAMYYHGWMRDEAETGGLWLQKATHDLDYITYLIDQQPIRICAMESKTVFRGEMPAGLRCTACDRQQQCMESPYNLFYKQGLTPSVEENDWSCSFAPDTGNHDAASAIIQYRSGMHAVYTQNFYTRRGAVARGATLIGYRGTINFDWYRDRLTVHYHHTNKTEQHKFHAEVEGHHGGDTELSHDYLAIVTGRGSSRSPLSAGILSAEMCLAARDSCRGASFHQFEADATVEAHPERGSYR